VIPLICRDHVTPQKTGPHACTRDPVKLNGSHDRLVLLGSEPKWYLPPATTPPRALRARPPTQGADGADAPVFGRRERREGAGSPGPTRGPETAVGRPGRANTAGLPALSKKKMKRCSGPEASAEGARPQSSVPPRTK